MSWLGQNGSSRQDFYALADAYKKMYSQENLQEDPELSEETLDEGRSSRPRYPGGRGKLTQDERDEKRADWAENVKGHTFGKGDVTKDPKKLRKQRAMGELPEEFETWLNDILDEGADLSEFTMDEVYEFYCEGKMPYPKEKVARKREAVKKKEDIAIAQGRDDDANKLYQRGVALALKTKMSKERKEEFETWLDEILNEGANLSEFTMDEMFDYWENEVLSEQVIDEYDVSYTDGCLIEEGKKSCKKGYKWDSKKGKCVKKKKSSSSSSKSSNKTVVVVGGRGGGYWGGGHHHGGGGGTDNGTDSGTDGGDGGDGGGDAGGGE